MNKDNGLENFGKEQVDEKISQKFLKPEKNTIKKILSDCEKAKVSVTPELMDVIINMSASRKNIIKFESDLSPILSTGPDIAKSVLNAAENFILTERNMPEIYFLIEIGMSNYIKSYLTILEDSMRGLDDVEKMLIGQISAFILETYLLLFDSEEHDYTKCSERTKRALEVIKYVLNQPTIEDMQFLESITNVLSLSLDNSEVKNMRTIMEVPSIKRVEVAKDIIVKLSSNIMKDNLSSEEGKYYIEDVAEIVDSSLQFVEHYNYSANKKILERKR